MVLHQIIFFLGASLECFPPLSRRCLFFDEETAPPREPLPAVTSGKTSSPMRSFLGLCGSFLGRSPPNSILAKGPPLLPGDSEDFVHGVVFSFF